MLKTSLLFKKLQTSRVNNSRILRIKNAKFSGYCFYMNRNIYGDFQICISVPLRCLSENFMKFFWCLLSVRLCKASSNLWLKILLPFSWKDFSIFITFNRGYHRRKLIFQIFWQNKCWLKIRNTLILVKGNNNNKISIPLMPHPILNSV